MGWGDGALRRAASTVLQARGAAAETPSPLPAGPTHPRGRGRTCGALSRLLGRNWRRQATPGLHAATQAALPVDRGAPREAAGGSECGRVRRTRPLFTAAVPSHPGARPPVGAPAHRQPRAQRPGARAPRALRRRDDGVRRPHPPSPPSLLAPGTPRLIRRRRRVRRLPLPGGRLHQAAPNRGRDVRPSLPRARRAGRVARRAQAGAHGQREGGVSDYGHPRDQTAQAPQPRERHPPQRDRALPL